jgi:hypothetical protein
MLNGSTNVAAIFLFCAEPMPLNKGICEDQVPGIRPWWRCPQRQISGLNSTTINAE